MYCRIIWYSSPLILHHVLEIASHFNNYQNEADLRSLVIPMQDKYLAYWSDIPMLYSFAFILDPRAKIRCFTNVLRILCNLDGTYYSCYLTEVRAGLSVIFAKRDSKFGSVRLPKSYTTVPRGKKKIAWSKIFGECRCFTTDSLPQGYPGQFVPASAYAKLDG